MSIKPHLIAKRDELIWALDLQGYSQVDIASMFNFEHRSTVMRIIDRRPIGWKAKWVKAGE